MTWNATRLPPQLPRQAGNILHASLLSLAPGSAHTGLPTRTSLRLLRHQQLSAELPPLLLHPTRTARTVMVVVVCISTFRMKLIVIHPILLVTTRPPPLLIRLPRNVWTFGSQNRTTRGVLQSRRIVVVKVGVGASKFRLRQSQRKTRTLRRIIYVLPTHRNNRQNQRRILNARTAFPRPVERKICSRKADCPPRACLSRGPMVQNE